MEVINKSLSEQIADVIKEKIINLELRPGQKINLDKLAQQCRTSRMPVRDALNKLVEKGLVKVNPRRGYFVVNLTEKRVIEICDLRKLLETFALKTSIFTIEKNGLKELLEETEKANSIYLSKQDRTLFDKTDRRLHWLIISHCGNEYLSKIFGEIFDLIEIVRHLQHRIKDALQEHMDLIKAMVKNDLLLSLHLLEYHLDQVKESTREAIKRVNKMQGSGS